MVKPSFDDLINQTDKPVLVDFWAEWCGPCHAVAPTIEQIAKDYKGRAVVVKVNVDNSPQLAAQFSIQSIPTLMLFDHGKAVWRQAGVQPYSAIAQQLDRFTVAV